jgi:hypothetical protein
VKPTQEEVAKPETVWKWHWTRDKKLQLSFEAEPIAVFEWFPPWQSSLQSDNADYMCRVLNAAYALGRNAAEQIEALVEQHRKASSAAGTRKRPNVARKVSPNLDLAKLIAKAIFTGGTGQVATRLALVMGEGQEMCRARDLSGWCQEAAVDQIETVLDKHKKARKEAKHGT